MNDTMPTTGKRFARAASSVPAARAFAREVLREACGQGLDDVLLCVSELATNAVRHGVPVGGAFLLRVGADERCVRVECHDAGRRLPRVRHPDHDEQGGRGLLLVDAVASRWGVEERPFGKYVWFELDAGLSEDTWLNQLADKAEAEGTAGSASLEEMAARLRTPHN